MIIGLSGKAYSGKDSFAKMLIEREPVFENKKYSGKLKKVAGIIAGRSADDFEDPEVKNSVIFSGLTGRALLIAIGQGLREKIAKDIWVNALLGNYEDHDMWVITDVRYTNEADAIKEKGGILIRINRTASVDEWNSMYDLGFGYATKKTKPISKEKWIDDFIVPDGGDKLYNELTHPSETELDFYEFDHEFNCPTGLKNIKKSVDKFLAKIHNYYGSF